MFGQMLIALLKSLGPYTLDILKKKIEEIIQHPEGRRPSFLSWVLILLIVVSSYAATYFYDQSQLTKPEEKDKGQPVGRYHSEDYLQRLLVESQLQALRKDYEISQLNYFNEKERHAETKKQLDTLTQTCRAPTPKSDPPAKKPTNERVKDRLETIRDKGDTE